MAHYLAVKIRGFHLDKHGYVNNVAFNYFLEDARWALFDNHNATEILTEMDLGLMLVNATINYRKPAKLNDNLEIQTKVMRIGQSSCQIDQLVYLADKHEPVLESTSTFALMNIQTGQAIDIEGEARRKLEQIASFD